MTRLNKMLIKLMMLMLMVEELQFAVGTGNECLECTDYPESVTILPAWQRTQGHGELGSPTEISLLLSNISLSPARMWLSMSNSSGSLGLNYLGLFHGFFDNSSNFVNHEDTNHVIVAQSSGPLASIVKGVVGITTTSEISLLVLNISLSPTPMCLNISYSSGSLGLNYLGFFDEFLDNSLDFVNHEDTHHVLDTNHVSVVQTNGHLAGIEKGSLGFDYLGFFDNSSNFVNREDTHHVSNVQSNGQLMGIARGVVGITPICKISLLVSNISLSPTLMWLSTSYPSGSLGLNYLGLFDGLFDNSSNFMNHEETHHVSKKNHVGVVQSNGHLAGTMKGVVGIRPISQISLLVSNISLSLAPMWVRISYSSGSLGLNYLGFFDEFLDNSLDFVNREDTHHVSNTNHVLVVQMNGQLVGIMKGVVGISPTNKISPLVSNISLNPTLMWLSISYPSDLEINIINYKIGSLGFNYLGFFDELFDNSLDFVNEDTHHVPNTNHVGVLQSSGHLEGIMRSVVGITPTSEISLLVSNISLSLAPMWLNISYSSGSWGFNYLGFFDGLFDNSSNFVNREDTHHLSNTNHVGSNGPLVGLVKGVVGITSTGKIPLLCSNISLSPAPMWLSIYYSSGSDLSHQFKSAACFDACFEYSSKLQISNRPDTNHVSFVQLSGHLAGIVIGVVAITSTIALATQLILRGRWFRRHGYPTARAFLPPGVNIQSEIPDQSEKLLSRMLRSFHAGLMAIIIRLRGEQTPVLDDRQWA